MVLAQGAGVKLDHLSSRKEQESYIYVIIYKLYVPCSLKLVVVLVYMTCTKQHSKEALG